MKCFVTTFLLIGFALTSLAQNDAAAKKILDDVSNKVKTFKGITADFNYKTFNKQKVKKGDVAGKINIKGQKYYIKQGTTEIFCNGTKVWNFNGSTEVTVSDVDGDSKTLSPQKLLTNFYDKDFTYKLVSSAGAAHQIVMVPTDKRKNFKTVTIFIDKAKSMITRAVIIDKTDNTVEFVLKNVNSNAVLSDASFVFNTAKYPKVEVIEQ